MSVSIDENVNRQTLLDEHDRRTSLHSCWNVETGYTHVECKAPILFLGGRGEFNSKKETSIFLL